MTAESDRLLNQSLKRVEIVVWSGSLDCLAFRLGMSHAELITALTRSRDMRRGTVKIEVAMARTAPIFEAAKRALLNDGSAEPADALLHLAGW